MTKKALWNLIGTNRKSEFFDSYRVNNPILSHDLAESIKEITDLPFLKSFEDLFEFWPKTVDCYLPGVADEVNSTTVSLEKAQNLFLEGRGLIFNDADTESETLKKWVDEIIAELGVSTLTYGRALIYAIPAGKVTDPHFDQNINFVLQIKGTKKWWIAPNESVEGPMTRYTIGTAMDPELASYTKEMPHSFPEDAEEFTLKPGSALFVPRGAWHTTKALDEDSLSLSFTLTAPTWIDLLTATLRARLCQSGQWRETANFVTNKEFFLEATEDFDLLLAQLSKELPYWCAKDILSATEMNNYPGVEV